MSLPALGDMAEHPIPLHPVFYQTLLGVLEQEVLHTFNFVLCNRSLGFRNNLAGCEGVQLVGRGAVRLL